ncbi:hypothetical protein ACLOJK_036014 [Asimina triloba]
MENSKSIRDARMGDSQNICTGIKQTQLGREIKNMYLGSKRDGIFQDYGEMKRSSDIRVMRCHLIDASMMNYERRQFVGSRAISKQGKSVFPRIPFYAGEKN